MISLPMHPRAGAEQEREKDSFEALFFSSSSLGRRGTRCAIVSGIFLRARRGTEDSSIKSVFSGVLCTERFVVFGRLVARRVSYLSIVLEQKITGNI